MSALPTAEVTFDTAPEAPGPSRWEAPRWLHRLSSDVLGTMDQLTATYGDIVMLRLGPQRIAIARGAEAAQHILIKHQESYPKAKQFDLFEPVLGSGLVTSAGETWRRSRRVVQPLFAKRHLSVYGDHMAQAAHDALEEWDRTWSADQPVDLDATILRVGFDTVCRALLSDGLRESAARFGGLVADSLHEIGEMSAHPGVFLGQDLPGVGIVRAAEVFTPRRWLRFEQYGEETHALVAALVDERISHGQQGREDLLAVLMESPDPETGERLSREQIIDEVITFVAAGHETTAHGLAWMFYLLGQNPEALEQLDAELDRVLAGRIPTAEDVEDLHWLTACFQEAMRLYPPAWHLPRVATEDDVVCGVRIPKNTRVLFSVWSTHRDPAVYEAPEEFRPERWLASSTPPPRLAYLPFGGGRRACVGQGFAMLNAGILGAMVAQRYHFAPAPGSIRLQPTITLRPIDGIPAYAHHREVGAPQGVVGVAPAEPGSVADGLGVSEAGGVVVGVGRPVGVAVGLAVTESLGDGAPGDDVVDVGAGLVGAGEEVTDGSGDEVWGDGLFDGLGVSDTAGRGVTSAGEVSGVGGRTIR